MTEPDPIEAEAEETAREWLRENPIAGVDDDGNPYADDVATLAAFICRLVATAERERDEARALLAEAKATKDMYKERAQQVIEDEVLPIKAMLDREREVRRGLVKTMAPAIGDLAERLALDMDHDNKDHSRWYRAVKKARAALAAAAEIKE